MLVLLAALSSSSVIGFDIGTETLKAAVIRSGRSVEMVLNEQSKRKTPSLVSFESAGPVSLDEVRRVRRNVGVSAHGILLRNSSAVMRAFPSVLGKVHSPELQEDFDSRLLDFHMEGELVNGLEPYIALGMLFEKMAKSAEEQVQQGAVRDAVVAVPAFFTNVQRKKVAAAVKLAGLNLLEIIDDARALALVYAVEKTSFFTREPRTVAIVDFGHGSLSVAGFKFSAKILTQKGRNPKPVPKIESLGYFWDDQVGGADLDVALAKYLSVTYGKTLNQVLLEDAQKLKHTLTLTDSANVTLDSFDERVIFTRDEFLSVCKGAFEKVRELMDSVNRTFDSVEFVGGASRIPVFQDIAVKALGPISRALNADEAIVTGAAYTAAITSGAFKLMDVNHDASSVHTTNLTFGAKEVRLFSAGSSLSKLKTARFDTSDATTVSLSYVSKVPVGCNTLINEWSIIHEGNYEPVSRIVLSFGFNKKSAVELSKSLLFTKNEGGEISQTPLNVKRTVEPLKVSREERMARKMLLNAFAANDVRLAKIAEARNALESLVFELKDATTNDPVWIVVTSDEEKVDLVAVVNETFHWMEENHDFEDDSIIKEKTRELEDAVKSVKYRVHESRTRQSSIHELEYLLNDMQDAVLHRWPARKLRVPKQQKRAILNHVKLTREWLERKREEQDELEAWDEPVLKTSELELRIKKLGDAFKALEDGVVNKKLKNRREDDDDDPFGADL